MAKPPVASKNQYNQELSGFFGEFGSGANSQIFFLQSAVKPAKLDKISLVSDLPGSEAWSVRDLFQREVNTERVTNSIVPYFEDQGKVKFFNPLTLTMLPVDPRTGDVLADMPAVSNTTIKLDDNDWECIEAPGLFRARHVVGMEQYGIFEWNDERIKIVAIDGQHRLSALKRIYKSPSENLKDSFLDWSIPIVLFSLRALDENKEKSSVLEIIRNIFVYINTAAKPPNETRQILLTDESVNAVCTQEILEYAHENDELPREERALEKLPLMFFDWRGAETWTRKGGAKDLPSPGALKSNVEIKNWLEYYVLGEDFKSDQRTALGIINPTHPLHKAFSQEPSEAKLSVQDSKALRELFRSTVLPGFSHFIENYEPIRIYVQRIRTIEHKRCNEGDIAKYAFHKLRFGNHNAADEIKDKVDVVYGEIIDEIQDEIFDLPQLIRHDIGMRGVVCAFAALRLYWQKYIKPANSSDWLEYSKWFTKHLNVAYEKGWLSKKAPQRVKDYLVMVTEDKSGTTINYRLQDANSALGAMLAIVVAALGFKGKAHSDGFRNVLDDFSDPLSSSMERGYRKWVKSMIKDDYPQGGKPLTDAVNKKASEETAKHMSKFEKYVNELNES